MGFLYDTIFKPVLFKQDPERAHGTAVFALKLLGQLGPVTKFLEKYNDLNLKPIQLFGLNFPNRVGIAAGFDKNAECYKATHAIGFGHIELGTITYQRQPGNPKPRLFRFPEDEAIINRMGFNNQGAQCIANHLAKHALPLSKRSFPIGINIGKSKAIPLENAAEDYLNTFLLLADYANYFTINVSSPNTQGLRSLQAKEQLFPLLAALKKANEDRAQKLGTHTIPLLVKITADLSFQEIDAVLEVLLDLKYDGIICSNTLLKRPTGLPKIEDCPGGLSGKPIFNTVLNAVKYIYLKTNGKLPIVACGGIMDPVTAGQYVDVGASLLQVYSGMVFKGPFIGRKLAQALAWTQLDWI